tara:strand:- start:26160 stop:26432 length:273 start_codon:yes stop_codon:yes gene_type:complete
MGKFYEIQMRRFGLLGSKAKPEEPKAFEERPAEPSEQEKLMAQERRRREKFKEVFGDIGSQQVSTTPPPQTVESIETDDDVLLGGLRGHL